MCTSFSLKGPRDSWSFNKTITEVRYDYTEVAKGVSYSICKQGSDQKRTVNTSVCAHVQFEDWSICADVQCEDRSICADVPWAQIGSCTVNFLGFSWFVYLFLNYLKSLATFLCKNSCCIKFYTFSFTYTPKLRMRLILCYITHSCNILSWGIAAGRCKWLTGQLQTNKISMRFA